MHKKTQILACQFRIDLSQGYLDSADRRLARAPWLRDVAGAMWWEDLENGKADDESFRGVGGDLDDGRYRPIAGCGEAWYEGYDTVACGGTHVAA